MTNYSIIISLTSLRQSVGSLFFSVLDNWLKEYLYNIYLHNSSYVLSSFKLLFDSFLAEFNHISLFNGYIYIYISVILQESWKIFISLHWTFKSCSMGGSDVDLQTVILNGRTNLV